MAEARETWSNAAYRQPVQPPDSQQPESVQPVTTPEQAITRANHDSGGNVHGTTHEQTLINLSNSRRAAISVAAPADVHATEKAYDRAQARLEAQHVVTAYKQDEPGEQRHITSPDATDATQTTYRDGTRIVQIEGSDANAHPVVTTQIFPPGKTGPEAAIPLEARTTVANGISTTTGLPERKVATAPDGKGTLITDVYGGSTAQDADRVVQHLVLPQPQGGYQVQSTTVRQGGVDVTDTPPLRIREYSADHQPLFDTGEVSKTTTEQMPGKPNIETVTHLYDSGYRMQYQVNVVPAGTDGIPRTLAKQSLTAPDGTVAFQQQGLTRTQTTADDGSRIVTDAAANGSKQVYLTDPRGRVEQIRELAQDGSLKRDTRIEQVTGLPVVTRRETVTTADGQQQITEFNKEGQPVGFKKVDASGQTVDVQGSLKGERIDASRASDVAGDILEQGDRRFRRDDYEKRLMYALETMQDLDPVSQQMVLEKLQEKDSGMAQSWFRTDILENLSPEQMRVLEQGGLDILTGVPGTTAADLQAIKKIESYMPEGAEAAQYNEYGGPVATPDERNAGQLQQFMGEYNARKGDPAAQARFVALYERMHSDTFATGFLSDESLGRARDGGLTLFNNGGTVKIDQQAYDTLMGDRLETEDDKRPEVLAARDRVMDAGVRRFMVDNQEVRVQALVAEMSKLDPGGQAALMRQIAKEDPDARLNWLRDGVIDDATRDNPAMTPQMRTLMTSIRANGDTTFMGQLQGFGGGVKDAGVGFVVGLGVLARTGYDLSGTGLIVDAVSGGDAPAWLPSAKRGYETSVMMVEGIPHMFDHIGAAWGEGRYGEALGNVTFDVASMLIPVKIPKIRLPGAAGAADNVATSSADNLASARRYVDQQGRAVRAPAAEPRLATAGADGGYPITDAPSATPGRPLALDGPSSRLALEPAASPAVIAERQAIASRFYERVNGRVDPSHLNGIDFTRPVEVRTLPKGSVVYQWQAPGAPKGQYFSPSATARPTDIGIAPRTAKADAYARIRELQQRAELSPPSGMPWQYSVELGPSGITDKVMTAYRVTEDVEVLVSTAKPIRDTWALPDNSMTSIPTEGGRLQYYTGKRDLFVPDGADAGASTSARPLDVVGRLPRGSDGRLGSLQPGQVLVGESRGIMRDHAARVISQTPNHPLRFLINPKTNQFWKVSDFDLSGYKGFAKWDNPVLLEMGHITSKKALSDGGDRLMLQSVFENQWNNRSIEMSHIGGEVTSQRAVNIDGVAVSYNDVMHWTTLKVDADMAERLAPYGYKVGDTLLPKSILDQLTDVY